MFEHLSEHRTIIVTGPHRSGTTICAEMIGADTGKRVYLEEAFHIRNILEAELLVRAGGVIQGPYLLPWAPMLAAADVAVVYMHRSAAEVDASNRVIREKGISTPFFSKHQADRLWERIRPLVAAVDVEYATLEEHPLWMAERRGWGHRQTRPGQKRGR